MSAPRAGGLGRGLAALIPPDDDEPGDRTPRRDGRAGRADVEGAGPGAVGHLAELPVDRIRPNPRQPRSVFDDDALAELADSIAQVGLLQPVVVRESEDGYELVVGERRWRAAQRAGLEVLPAVVRHVDDDALLRDALLENLHRAQLDPLEEAAAYAQLLDDFGATHAELAQRLGRSRSAITNTLRLLNLAPPVQRRLQAGVLTAGHARALLGVDDAARQERLADRVVAEGLSVRSTEEAVALDGPEAPPDDARAAGPAGRRGGARPTPPEVADLARRLGDRLDTRVQISVGARKGKVVVEFSDLADLRRVLDGLDPTLAADLLDGA